jgi:hypothetical protein
VNAVTEAGRTGIDVGRRQGCVLELNLESEKRPGMRQEEVIPNTEVADGQVRLMAMASDRRIVNEWPTEAFGRTSRQPTLVGSKGEFSTGMRGAIRIARVKKCRTWIVAPRGTDHEECCYDGEALLEGGTRRSRRDGCCRVLRLVGGNRVGES